MSRRIAIAIAAAMGLWGSAGAEVPAAPAPQQAVSAPDSPSSASRVISPADHRRRRGDDPRNLSGEVGTDASQSAEGTDTSRDQAPGTGMSGSESGVQGTSSDTSAVSDTTSSSTPRHHVRRKVRPQGTDNTAGEVMGHGTHVGGTGRVTSP